MAFDLNFNIKNPFYNSDIHKQNTVICYTKQMTKNKFFEFQVDKSWCWNLIEFKFTFSLSGSDHAGIELTVQLGKIYLQTCIRDKRHWNYSKNCWMQDYKEWLNDLNSFISKFNMAPVKFDDVSEYYNNEMTPIEAGLELNSNYKLLD